MCIRIHLFVNDKGLTSNILRAVKIETRTKNHGNLALARQMRFLKFILIAEAYAVNSWES